MDLKLVHGGHSETELYASQLAKVLADISPALLSQHTWDKDLVSATPLFVNEHVGVRTPITFEGISNLARLELKLYWARLLADPRMNSRSNIERRRLPMSWFQDECDSILQRFNAGCIADIPHPEFPFRGHSGESSKREHNQQLVAAFSDYESNQSRQKVCVEYVCSSELKKIDYSSPRITIVGDLHKRVVIQREQFKPLHKRDIVYLNDIYSERDVRFKDVQRQNDQYLNYSMFPDWLKPAVREHVMDKVTHGELAPKTLPGYVSRLRKFSAFMHERFANPSPSMITKILVEDDFVAWGNAKGLSGKNWYTDCVAMLSTASRKWPDIWPSIPVSHRATKKIDNTHYKEGLGRMGQVAEGANRAYSQRIVDDIRAAVEDSPQPVPRVFAIILGAGMRAEDGHAILFDCLAQDPTDDDFMLLTFWQNKVKKWNVKPLHKKDAAHAELIGIIEAQRADVVSQYGKATKYLFPVFNGTHESFIAPSYTAGEIKRQCVKKNVLADDGGSLVFSWHPLRHTKGTSMALAGHDVLSIMMELGHASPDMAMAYINNRLELKKKALLENGGGRFYTIEGRVDDRVSELLVRKEQICATRVCGGACTMPAQIGDWCEHANACYTCKHFRADAKDLEFFKVERASLIGLIDAQQEEANTLQEHGRARMSEITGRRLAKNKEVYKRLSVIVTAIESDGQYQGEEQQFKKASLEADQ